MKIIPIETKIHMGYGVFDENGTMYITVSGEKAADVFIRQATDVDSALKFTKKEVMVLEINF